MTPAPSGQGGGILLKVLLQSIGSKIYNRLKSLPNKIKLYTFDLKFAHLFYLHPILPKIY